jgi:hypothetical protein
VSLTNKDNITVPFGSSDVKALLTYFLAEYDQIKSDAFVAQRCKYDLKKDKDKENVTACKDINSGSFHVILANQLAGKNPVGFIVDRDRSFRVWNQPVYSFSSKIGDTREPSKGAAPGTKKEVKVVTLMTYGKETAPSWDPHPTYPVSEEYSYYLELDEAGNIIGGSHETWDRPDFQWLSAPPAPFSGYFKVVQQIYEASIKNITPSLSNVTESVVPVVARAPELQHSFMSAASGSFGVVNYTSNHRQSWTVAPKNAKSIRLRFAFFETERHTDKLKIYEGSRGEGPLVAVFSGTEIPEEMVVHSPEAYVLFTTDDTVNMRGFKVYYSSTQ